MLVHSGSLSCVCVCFVRVTGSVDIQSVINNAVLASF